MRRVRSLVGWSVTLPIVGRRGRFVAYAESVVGMDRAFCLTRKEARAVADHYRSWNLRGGAVRVCRATLTLAVDDAHIGR